MTHLRALLVVICTARKSLLQTDTGLWSFVLEQTLWFAINANNVGLSDKGNQESERMMRILDNFAKESSLPGIMFGCAYELFELIPKVARFAQLPAETLPRETNASLLSIFHSLENKILSWQPSQLGTLTDMQNCAPVDPVVIRGALAHQTALLILIRAALWGPGKPGVPLLEQIESLLIEFTSLLEQLPMDHSIWAMLLWAMITAGSCMQEPAQQQLLRQCLYELPSHMHITTRVMQVLQQIWSHPGFPEDTYGPFGLARILSHQNLRLSLG
jgi:hypothetical protein